jgi:serine protease Do
VTVPSGTVPTGEGLTPAQVYAMNAASVVAVNVSVKDYYGEGTSAGSGFILTEDGYVVTNYHVVEGGTAVSITLVNGETLDAKVVGYDATNDIAVLKTEAQGLPAVALGSSAAMNVGDMVVAIGNPLGELNSTQTVGFICGKDREITTGGTIINMLQTDAAINPGNSGGPLFNMAGQVIGITTAKYSGATSSGASIEGIGFAIPIADVMSMTEDLITNGYRTNMAYLGVVVMDLDGNTAAMYSLPMGSYVRSVEEGSCAEKAGIQPKDIIIAVGEYSVEGNSTLQSALRKFRAGDSTTVTVYRAGAELELPITFDERPQDPNASLEQQPPQESGEMPSSGSFEDWYNYFAPFFDNGRP